jgi:hypothetical protein
MILLNEEGKEEDRYDLYKDKFTWQDKYVLWKKVDDEPIKEEEKEEEEETPVKETTSNCIFGMFCGGGKYKTRRLKKLKRKTRRRMKTSIPIRKRRKG